MHSKRIHINNNLLGYYLCLNYAYLHTKVVCLFALPLKIKSRKFNTNKSLPLFNLLLLALFFKKFKYFSDLTLPCWSSHLLIRAIQNAHHDLKEACFAVWHLACSTYDVRMNERMACSFLCLSADLCLTTSNKRNKKGANHEPVE